MRARTRATMALLVSLATMTSACVMPPASPTAQANAETTVAEDAVATPLAWFVWSTAGQRWARVAMSSGEVEDVTTWDVGAKAGDAPVIVEVQPADGDAEALAREFEDDGRHVTRVRLDESSRDDLEAALASGRDLSDAIESTDARQVTSAADEVTWPTPLRVAHRRNSSERVSVAWRFAGIEVDVQGDVGDDVKLFHDTDRGYRLREFLREMSLTGQVAVLDLKDAANVATVTRIVDEEGMTARCAFQTASTDVAREVRGCLPDARLWLLASRGESGVDDAIRTLKKSELDFEVVNVPEDDFEGRNLKKTVSKLSKAPQSGCDVCVYATERRGDVYNDEGYGEAGATMLMTDVCPPDYGPMDDPPTSGDDGVAKDESAPGPARTTAAEKTRGQTEGGTS